jgi:hypothetical protein
MLTVKDVKTDQLKTWASRPKQSKEDCRAVMESIKTFGFLVPILCDSRHEVIAGHVRLAAARRLRMKTVPVIVLPVKGWKRRAFAIAENELSRKRAWKQNDIAKHLRCLAEKGFDAPSLGFDEPAIKALLEEEKSLNWKSIDHQAGKSRQAQSSCLTIKVPLAAKDIIKTKATNLAKKLGIKNSTTPGLVGAVVMDLLGVNQ